MGFTTSPAQRDHEKQNAKSASKKQEKLSASQVVRPEHIVTSEAQQAAEAGQKRKK